MKLLTFDDKEILGLIPAQAILDYDQAKEVLDVVAQGQAKVTRDEIIVWGDEFCEEHHSLPFPTEIGGGLVSRSKHLRRRQCPKCWQGLRDSEL